MSARKPLLKTLLLFSILHITNAGLCQFQDTTQKSMLKALNVKVVSCYKTAIINDSATNELALLHESFYNANGINLQRINYDTSKATGLYKYKYNQDNHLVETTRYYGDSLDRKVGIDLFEYDSEGRLSRVKFSSKNQLQLVLKYSYNKKGLLKKIKPKSYTRTKNPTWKFYYNETNQLAKKKISGDDLGYLSKFYHLEYDKYGNHIKTYSSPNRSKDKILVEQYEYDGQNRLFKVIRYNQTSFYDLDPVGVLNLKKGDILIKTIDYLENGLIDTEKRWLNDKLKSVKKYKYTT